MQASFPEVITKLNGRCFGRARSKNANPIPPLCAIAAIRPFAAQGGLNDISSPSTVGLKVGHSLFPVFTKPSEFGPLISIPVLSANADN